MKSRQLMFLILSLAVSISLCLCLTGCGKNSTQDSKQDKATQTEKMIPQETVNQEVNDFESCEAAGNIVLAGNPRICTYDGNSYLEMKNNAPETDEANTLDTVTPPETDTLVGADLDEHGCKASAGYQWCPDTDKCQRFWEEPCPPEDESESEWDFVQTYDEETDNAGNIALTYVVQLQEFNEFSGRGERVNNVQKKDCEGCFDVEVQYERDSPKAQGIVVTATFHVTLVDWVVTDHTATYTEI